jgi:xyloglucan-specific exo-beta-1,4-glucanase
LVNWPTDSAWNIESFALDRQNPNVLWIAQGKVSTAAGSLMKYDGTKWTTLSPTGLKVSGNDDRDDSTKLFRWSGERLGVDPFVSNRVIHVSRMQGVFVSTNGGTSWAAPSGVPTYTTPLTGQVVFDERNGVVGTASRTYIVIETLGVFSGTTSFSRIDTLTPPTGCAKPPISTLRPMRTKMFGGYLYIAFSNAAQNAGAVWRYNVATTCWTNVTPPAGGATMGYTGLAVDPTNPKRIFVAQDKRGTNAIFRCTNTDTPSTCVTLPVTSKVADVKWWPSSFWAATISDISFDFRRPSRAIYTTWFGAWFTENAWATSTNWTTHEWGHEEVVPMTVGSSKACPLLAGGADVNGFCHASLNTYPTASQQWQDPGGSYDASGVAVALGKPTMVVRVGGFKNGGLSAGVSGNGGQSFTSMAPASLPAGEFGKVALAANGNALSSICHFLSSTAFALV